MKRERLVERLRLLPLLIMLLLSSCHNRRVASERDDTGESGVQAPGPASLADASEYARRIGTAAVVVLEDGEVVYEFGDITRKYMCHSIRKPFLGALYGIYVQRGVIDIDTTLEELGIDDITPSLTHAEKQATIRDLLMSRSGVYHEAGGEAQQMIDTRPERGSHRPGEYFYYNNWDFNTLGTIFRQVTGKDVFETFYEEIARPIGMQDFSPDDCTYVYEREKSQHPSYFFRMSTRDMAGFGLLYQNFGSWKGRQIVPEQWIRQSTSVYPVGNPGGDPYGFLWRIIPEEAGLGRGFYHTGLGVHLLAVLPERRMVLVHRVDTDNDFDVTWQEIRTLMEMIVKALDLSER
jgi:CubicO group peptidase (beta-lactamase class C family)